jgi:hypothetical protein
MKMNRMDVTVIGAVPIRNTTRVIGTTAGKIVVLFTMIVDVSKSRSGRSIQMDDDQAFVPIVIHFGGERFVVSYDSETIKDGIYSPGVAFVNCLFGTYTPENQRTRKGIFRDM